MGDEPAQSGRPRPNFQYLSEGVSLRAVGQRRARGRARVENYRAPGRDGESRRGSSTTRSSVRASSALWAAIIVLFSKRLKRDVLHSGAAPFASSALPLGNPSVPTFFRRSAPLAPASAVFPPPSWSDSLLAQPEVRGRARTAGEIPLG